VKRQSQCTAILASSVCHIKHTGLHFEVWPGPTPRALQKKTPAWGEPAGVHGIGCRVSVSADTGKLTFYRVVRPALLFSGRSYKPPVHSRQKGG
jgi:hypothetical protein